MPDASAQTLGAGSYSYLAVYSGNSNYTAKSAACEPFKVSQAQLVMTTKVHNADHVDVNHDDVDRHEAGYDDLDHDDRNGAGSGDESGVASRRGFAPGEK